MTRTRRSTLLVLLAVSVGLTALSGAIRPASAATTGHTSVLPGTRVVLRDGVPFVGKGFTYWPQAIGDEIVSAQSWADPATCEQDARLLQGAGVTLLRAAYEYWLESIPTVQANYQACADAFHAHGIGIAWLVNIAANQPGFGYAIGDNPVDRTLWVEHYWTYLNQAITHLKDHPATNFWVLGNEIEGPGVSDHAKVTALLGDKTAVPPRVGLLDELYVRARAADPNHLVGTTFSGAPLYWRKNSNVPHLQFWGLNLYQAFSPGTMFADLVDPASPMYDDRPNIITEFGTDRFYCNPGYSKFSDAGNPPHYGAYDCLVPGSGEYQQGQANHDGAAWDNIAAALATPGNPQAPFFGGLVMTYVDQWDYSLAALNPELSSWVHDVISSTNFSRPDDGYETFEWWGVTHAQFRGNANPPRRVTSLAFDALAQRWTGTAAPTISNASVTFDADCRATVTWDTAIPADTEVQEGPYGRVLTAAGTTESDSTLFSLAHTDSTFTTHHVATMGFTIAKGVEYAWALRSTAAAERSATYPPIIATCPV